MSHVRDIVEPCETVERHDRSQKLEVADLGDAVEETKERSLPPVIYDNPYNLGYHF